MEDNSLSYSLNIWFLGILIPIIILFWFFKIISFGFGDDDFVYLLLSPLAFWLFSLPLHGVFVFGNEKLFKIIKSERSLRTIINIVVIVIISLIFSFFIFFVEKPITVKSLFSFFFEIILNSILVWKLKIEREEVKHKLPPTRPDILDDDLQ